MARINSRAKGARGERQWAHMLTDAGFPARRGQQFCGGGDSPDVICEALKRFHFECKWVENLPLNKALDQADADRPKGAVPVVVHKRNVKAPNVILPAAEFLRILGLAIKAGYPAGQRNDEDQTNVQTDGNPDEGSGPDNGHDHHVEVHS